MKDAKDNVLADLIIGKADKDQPAVRYVRKADRDQVYKVVDPDRQTLDQVRRLDRKGPAEAQSARHSLGADERLLERRWLTAQGQSAGDATAAAKSCSITTTPRTPGSWTDLIEYVRTASRWPERTEGKRGAEHRETQRAENRARRSANRRRRAQAGRDERSAHLDRRSPASNDRPSAVAAAATDSILSAIGTAASSCCRAKAKRSSTSRTAPNTCSASAIANQRPGKATNEARIQPAKKSRARELNRYMFVMAQFDPDLIPKPDARSPAQR